MRCLDCRDNFCDLCAKAHTLHKSSISHHIVKIGSETEDDMRRISPTRNCSLHNQKPLDYHCPKCQNIFCVSCVLENHGSHGCKDVSTVESEFRKIIEKNALKISTYADEISPKSISVEKKKEDILLNLAKTESEIRQRHFELKEMIDNHTTTLLEELSRIKQKHVKDCENEKKEIERSHTILKSFETYCNELRSKGSASDVCSCVGKLIRKANELEKDNEIFMSRPSQTTEVSFKATDFGETLSASNSNIVGRVEENLMQVEDCVLIAGLYDGQSLTKDVMNINLRYPQKCLTLKIPTRIRMQNQATAAVYRYTMYVTGIGDKCEEIRKYNLDSGWKKCASLVQGRSAHSSACVDEVLYICGGYAFSDGAILDSVETYNVSTNICARVGKLVQSVKSSGNCVPFKSSIYIFGGTGKDNSVRDQVQVYDTKQNTCALLSKPMPRGYNRMQALRWKTSVILLGCDTCFIFDFETETWQETEQFKTDAVHFGLALENERIYVIGGGMSAPDQAGNTSWKCRDDVRYVQLKSIIGDKPVDWKSYAKLEKPVLIQTYGKLAF